MQSEMIDGFSDAQRREIPVNRVESNTQHLLKKQKDKISFGNQSVLVLLFDFVVDERRYGCAAPLTQLFVTLQFGSSITIKLCSRLLLFFFSSLI
jgi:hypothetical protein